MVDAINTLGRSAGSRGDGGSRRAMLICGLLVGVCVTAHGAARLLFQPATPQPQPPAAQQVSQNAPLLSTDSSAVKPKGVAGAAPRAQAPEPGAAMAAPDPSVATESNPSYATASPQASEPTTQAEPRDTYAAASTSESPSRLTLAGPAPAPQPVAPAVQAPYIAPAQPAAAPPTQAAGFPGSPAPAMTQVRHYQLRNGVLTVWTDSNGVTHSHLDPRGPTTAATTPPATRTFYMQRAFTVRANAGLVVGSP